MYTHAPPGAKRANALFYFNFVTQTSSDGAAPDHYGGRAGGHAEIGTAIG